MRGRRRTGEITGHAPFPIAADHLELIKHVPQGGTWRDIPRHLLPDRYRGMRRTDSTNLLGRLDPDLPSYTVTTQFNNVTTGCFTHPYYDRALTPREAARLQTFPDRYEFSGSGTSICRQIGNAVPPLLAHVLAAAIAERVMNPDVAKELHPAPAPVKPAKQLPAPPPSTGTTRSRMRRQGRRDTKPEVLLRRHLTKLGFRYRVDCPPVREVRSKADIVFTRQKVAVYVHGCFWHGCTTHSRETKSNTKWWADKIEANRRRDASVQRSLRRHGWSVLVVWEHDDPAKAGDRVALAVKKRTPAQGTPRLLSA